MTSFRQYYLNSETEEEINDLFNNSEIIKWDIVNESESQPLMLIQYQPTRSGSVKPKIGSQEERETVKAQLEQDIDGLEIQLKNLKAEVKKAEEEAPDPEPEVKEEPFRPSKPVKPACEYCGATLPWQRNKDDFDFHKNGLCTQVGEKNGEE